MLLYHNFPIIANKKIPHRKHLLPLGGGGKGEGENISSNTSLRGLFLFRESLRGALAPWQSQPTKAHFLPIPCPFLRGKGNPTQHTTPPPWRGSPFKTSSPLRGEDGWG